MRKTFFLGLSAAAMLAASAAYADQTGRYVFQKSGDGFARLDSETGQISLCENKSDQLTCRPATEEKQASQSEIDRLNQKIDRLEKRVADLEKRVVSPKDLLPSDEQVDRTLGIMERFFRRFMDIARDFDKTFRHDEQPQATPEKT
jgi:peptidoglycan hydrolase CwlO-like protein